MVDLPRCVRPEAWAGRRGMGIDEMLDAPLAVRFVHRVRFTRSALDPRNATLADVIEATGDGPVRVLGFIDSAVAAAWPGIEGDFERYVEANADHMRLAGPVRVVPGGEAIKNDRAHLDAIVAAIHDAGLCRQSYVIAIGGGAVLDAVGFAAAMAHRGIRLVRLPTTTLAQGDSGVGVKNGVNAFGKKNYLGTFAVPWAVVNDEEFLTTLSDRDWRCGLSEAVKVALVKDAPLFALIEKNAARLARRDSHAASPVIRRSAELHLRHIVDGGDPFEMDRARPLDFGHWSAHKLEQITDFEVRHGEAVAIGVALDVLYSALAGHLDESAALRILDCLRTLGFSLDHEALDEPGLLLDGLEEFREHLGGPLAITLLSGIGRSFDVHTINRDLMVAAMDRMREPARRAKRCAG